MAEFRQLDDIDGIPSTFGVTFGALLLGTFVGLILFGLTAYQTGLYLRMYPTDVQRLKAMVITLFFADALHSVLCIHLCFYYLITSRTDFSLLQDGVWSLRLLTPSTGIIVFLVQGFYARRVYMLGRQFKACVFLVVALMIGEIVSVLYATVDTFIIRSFARWASHSWLSAIPFAFSVAIDVVLTTTLIVILHKSRTGMRQTDSLLNVLIVYTVNTGLLTSTLSILCVVFAAAQRQTFIYIALNMPTTKTYANSMLAVLNSRRALAEHAQDVEELGTFGMTMPSITTANVVVTRRRASPPAQLVISSVKFAHSLSTDDTGASLHVNLTDANDESAQGGVPSDAASQDNM
ncbi:hypothetical protein BV20DRAFT_962846 [Pilatotrama ljubarskyi]|nr:hypothetical protein BV20DRAFT_962846 [Pilatotrama ljubarskyi]